uniref:Metalloendopeptidase n=1 Tax=Rhabditophanes sp. KR3021 TaxID=114890 RepID=A0AC35TSB3_9BILA
MICHLLDFYQTHGAAFSPINFIAFQIDEADDVDRSSSESEYSSEEEGRALEGAKLNLLLRNLKNIGAKAAKYWQQFSGNNISKILTKYEMLFEGLHGLDAYKEVFRALNNVKKMSVASTLSDEEVLIAIEAIEDFETAISDPSLAMTVQPKVHLLVHHMPEKIRCFKSMNYFSEHDFKESPMQNPDLFQGYILLTPDQGKAIIESLKQQLKDVDNNFDQKHDSLGKNDSNISIGDTSGFGKVGNDYETVSKREKRSLSTGLLFEWQFPIKYYLSLLLASETRIIIHSAVAEIKANTCIRYSKQSVPISGSAGLNVVYGTGCFSWIGRIYSNQPQDLSIGEGCRKIGSIHHEFGHALGLEHEQSRPDRDLHIYTNPGNLAPGAEGELSKSAIGSVKDFGVGFDFGSALLYNSYAFSSNGHKILEPKNPGQNKRFLFSDYKILNFNYSNLCTQCLCPNGFAGTQCDMITGMNAACGLIVYGSSSSPQTLTRTGNMNCYFAIIAFDEARVKITVNSYKVSPASLASPCSVGTDLEVRGTLDMVNTGALFCGTSTSTKIIHSHGYC